MSFAQDNGYTPETIEEIMDALMANINTQFADQLDQPFTTETFAGTNFYKFFYAAAQRMQENEVKTSEIFLKLQQYIRVINASISRPPTTPEGISDFFGDPDNGGWVASVKPMIDADAGKLSICVNVDDGVHANGNITITSFANLLTVSADTVAIDGTTFTAQAGAATPGTGTFQAATSNNATAASLAAQINSHATAGAKVRATVIGAIVTITAIQGGTGGNALTLAYTDNGAGNIGATKSGTTLSGGTTNADYATNKLAICNLVRQCCAAGIVSQGTEVSTIVLTNGQSFDFKFVLPNTIPIKLRLTLTASENSSLAIPEQEDISNQIFTQINARYRLGLNFEPQKYFEQSDAPWTSQVLLEWSTDAGSTWSSSVFEATFDKLYTFGLDDIAIEEV